MKIMNKKVLIFDLFHTLTDLESKWASLPTTSEFLQVDTKKWNELLHYKTRDRLCGIEKDEFKIIANMARKLNPNISDRKIFEAVNLRKERFRQSLIKIPEINISVLKKLKSENYKLVLISNADVMEKAGWNDSPLLGIFDVEIFSCDVGFMKPEKEIYELACRLINSKTEECIFIGDGGSDELRGAQNVGMKTIFIRGIMEELWSDKIDERRKSADYEIKFLPEILELI